MKRGGKKAFDIPVGRPTGPDKFGENFSAKISVSEKLAKQTRCRSLNCAAGGKSRRTGTTDNTKKTRSHKPAKDHGEKFTARVLSKRGRAQHYGTTQRKKKNKTEEST